MRKLVVLAIAALIAATTVVAPASHDGDRTGVTPDSLTVGLHFSATGTSPLPGAVVKGAQMYWSNLHDDRGILVHGRRVTVSFANDDDNPTSAAFTCRELAQSSFLVTGFSRTEVMAACGRDALAAQGVPYFHVGSSEASMSSATTSYAVTATHRTQAGIIGRYIVTRLPSSVDRYGGTPITLPVVGELPLLTTPGPDGYVRIGLVRQSSAAYDEAESALRTALEGAGHPLDKVYYVTKEGTSAQAREVPAMAHRDGVDVLVFSTSASFALLVIRNADSDGYAPRYIGLGVTGAWDRTAEILCGQSGSGLHDASLFTGWPAGGEASTFDADFGLAAQKYASESDLQHRDLLAAGWGMMKNVHRIIDAAGPDPTREDVLAMLGAGFTAQTGFYPNLSVSSGDHFGADAVHHVQADCATGRFHEREAFVTSY